MTGSIDPTFSISHSMHSWHGHAGVCARMRSLYRRDNALLHLTKRNYLPIGLNYIEYRQ